MSDLALAQRRIAEEKELKSGCLDLRDLDLDEIPVELKQLRHLKVLRLGMTINALRGGNRRLSEVHDLGSIANLEQLRQLDFSFTRVADLTPLAELAKLESLECDSTAVADLTPLAGLVNLRSLAFVGTQVTDLAPLAALVNLESLDFGFTEVANLEPLANLTNLLSLDCSSTDVADLMPLAELTNLQTLTCSGTAKIVDLRPLAGLTNLQSLECSNTGVADLTPLAGLTNLLSLDCRQTRVADLTPLAGLTNLLSLSCRQTQVADLSPLAEVTSLQGLDCGSTQVADLTPLAKLANLQDLNLLETRVVDLGPLAGLVNLQNLNCSNAQVFDLTPLVGLAKLQSLSCWSTDVVDLTPLTGLANLQAVHCGDTQVADLTPLAGLSNLQDLTCWNAQVTDFTPLVGLANLRSLNCQATQISDLTPLAGLGNLRWLCCAHTEVADLTPLGALASLQGLYCGGTQVAELTPLIGLERLQEVDASRCHLVKVPEELLFSVALRYLYLHEAKLPGVPSEVLSQYAHDNCLERLRDHFRDLAQGEEEVRDAKLLVLGNGRVGKTQICRRLRGEGYDESIPSTHGVHVTTAPQPASADGEGGALHIWDFGGQDIYHGTHALFLRTRAIFLIVWSPDSETRGQYEDDGILFRDFPLPHWLEYVKNLGGRGSPVILIQSKCDRPELECPIPPVEERFLAFKFRRTGCYSAKNDRGRASLDESLQLAIEHLHEQEGVALIGTGRMRVRRKLEAWKEADSARAAADREHRTLTHQEFGNLCKEAGGVSSVESLLDFLHNSGVVFHRKGLFADRIILDQSWALEAVYSVFDRKESYRQIRHMRGRFTRSFLGATVWRDYELRDQELFLSLMESCGVCFLHRAGDPRREIEAEYIAPDLLPDRGQIEGELAGRWTDDAVVEHRYDFSFLSQAVIRSAISAIGKLAGESAVYWKDGVWIYEARTGARAIVELRMEDERRGSIAVECQGGRGRELLSRIQELLDRLPPFQDAITERVGSLHDLSGGSLRKPADEGAADDKEDSKLRFVDLPPDLLGKETPEVFISYAWGDDTPAGRQREQIVADVCHAMAASHVKLIRDRYEMGAGDRISRFMRRLSRGDFVIAVISDKYLRSPYCMFELFHIFRHCGDDPGRFLDKVIPLVLADARIGSVRERLEYVRHWKSEKEALQAEIQELGADYVDEETYAHFKLIQEFAEKVGKMLAFLNDKLMPRDFDRMASEGFQELVGLLRAEPEDA